MTVNTELDHRYGPSTRPVAANAGATASTIEAWAGIDEVWLLDTLHDLAQACVLDRRPTSLAYFRAAVLDRWEAYKSDERGVAAYRAAIAAIDARGGS